MSAPRRYVRHEYVQAMQWDGTDESGLAIARWAASQGIAVDYQIEPDRFADHPGAIGQRLTIRPRTPAAEDMPREEWLVVVDDSGAAELVGPLAFADLYEIDNHAERTA